MRAAIAPAAPAARVRASSSAYARPRDRPPSIAAATRRHRHRVVRASARDADADAAPSPPSSSRREALVSAITLALATTTLAFPARADDDAFAADASTSIEEDPIAPADADPPKRPAASSAAPPVRYKGDNWSVVVPGAYARKATEKPRRIYEQRIADCEPNCRDLQAKRTDETPLVARFGSDDGGEDVSVSVRGANTLKLTFLQIKDVREFGEAREAAPLFIPPGAKLLDASARIETSPSGVEKGYYTYDFEYGEGRVLLTAAVELGNVYLLGATAGGAEAWSRAESGFRRAAKSFKVGAEDNLNKERAGAGAGAGDENGAIELPGGTRAPGEDLNCRGPLPIFCSVEPSS